MRTSAIITTGNVGLVGGGGRTMAGAAAWLALGLAAAMAQPAPSTNPPAASAPASVAPGPTAPATAAAPSAEAPAPAATAPAAAPATPAAAPPPATAAPVTPAPAAPAASVLPTDEAIAAAGFADEVMLEAKPALVRSGKTVWDDLFGAFRRTIAELKAVAAREGAEITGPPMVRFLSSSDDAVDFEAILPVKDTAKPAAAYAPAAPGTTPAGKTLRFVHHGGYDTMEQTYDEIANHLDERNILAEDAFVEEYVRDPDTTPETAMAIFIYVFPKATPTR
ncbi:GyrI-like domain-containing protein [Phreatobacter oligotrophus]|uniref:Effector-binding domain-containing protein n=1 Tax=Phreatobacter oligotrophus TaxID=1122261 RepID=A0A2T4YYP0_9HYPH|nr:GyrI-like domain-containing protein [Phreatobacter oligotrophus]PTM51820.1 effector-binding domain-containing protein [Phreatobacter oligotrophus]